MLAGASAAVKVWASRGSDTARRMARASRQRRLLEGSTCNALRPERQLLIVSLLVGESIERKADNPNAGLLGDFERLYRAQVGAVTAYFARRSREPQTVADLTSETFLEAMRSFASFDPRRGDVRPWLFAIARHVYAKNSVRGARERDAAARHAGRRTLDADESEEMERRIDAERRGRELVERLSALPALDREAIELVDVAELTPKEAAKVLGVSSGGLRVRLSRARARLRKEHGINV